MSPDINAPTKVDHVDGPVDLEVPEEATAFMEWRAAAGRECDPPLTGHDERGSHALARVYPPHERVMWTRLSWGDTLCGGVASWAEPSGAFDPDRRAETTCPECVWLHAIRGGGVECWLTRLADDPGRVLPVAVAKAVLAEAADEDYELDDDPVVQLLATVWVHAGEGLVEGDCVEGECDHPSAGCPVGRVACRAGSLQCEGWAGEWQGRHRPEAIVDTPCSVLAALAAHYHVGAALRDETLGALLVTGGPRGGKCSPLWPRLAGDSGGDTSVVAR